MKERREWLEDAMRLHQFYRDVEDVQLWMTSNKPIIGNVSIGKILGTNSNKVLQLNARQNCRI